MKSDYFNNLFQESCPSLQKSYTKETSLFNWMLSTKSSSGDYFDENRKILISFCSIFFLSKMQAEKKKAGSGDDCHGNPEIDRLRKEVQDTKEINKKLRDLLQVQQHTKPRSLFHTFVMNN